MTPAPRLLAGVTSPLRTWEKETATEWLGGGATHRGTEGAAAGGVECRPAALFSVLLTWQVHRCWSLLFPHVE